MSAITIDRVDHTNPHLVAALALPIANIAISVRAEGSNMALPDITSAADVSALVQELGAGGGVFICRDGTDVVAFATVRPDPEEGGTAVMGTWVRVSHRRRGLGTELARAATEFARDSGYTKLRGTIPSSNQSALSFFSAIGPLVQLEAGAMGYELPV